jgi:uncharacterized protein YbjT (DUF2867 family)
MKQNKKILLTGANGYIGTRLLSYLLEEGHEVVALVRSKSRIALPVKFASQLKVIQGDLLDLKSLQTIPKDIDAAYYLVHSMSVSEERFSELEAESAHHFVQAIEQTNAKQIIYLSGLVNDASLSRHLTSRKRVDEILRDGKIPVTTLMAGIIIGSGSASFEIMRDLVEKLPIMITPRWVYQLVQPIGVHDVMAYLIDVLLHPDCLGKGFEIGGPDILTYKDLLLTLAKVRHLKRWIVTVPVLTPTISSYWLYFMTSANYALAKSLVESLKNNAICKEHAIEQIFPKKLLTVQEAIERAFKRIEEDNVPSSWKDAIGDSGIDPNFSKYIQVPQFGVLIDEQQVKLKKPKDEVIQLIWSLGGNQGWLFMNFAWKIRGFIDKCVGGVGLRRGRTHLQQLKSGDALDFWRVLLADKKGGRLLLYAEMKLPGEAWLEFRVDENKLIQKATFRPHGILGRAYWYGLYPVHYFIFRSLARQLAT